MLTNTHDLFIYEFDTATNILSVFGYTRNAVRSDGCTRFKLIFYKVNEREMMRVRYISGRLWNAIGEKELNRFFAQKMDAIAVKPLKPQYRFDMLKTVIVAILILISFMMLVMAIIVRLSV